MDEKKTITTTGISGVGQDARCCGSIKKKHGLASMNGRRHLLLDSDVDWHTHLVLVWVNRKSAPGSPFFDQSLNCDPLISFLGHTE